MPRRRARRPSQETLGGIAGAYGSSQAMKMNIGEGTRRRQGKPTDGGLPRPMLKECGSDRNVLDMRCSRGSNTKDALSGATVHERDLGRSTLRGGNMPFCIGAL